MEPTYEEKPWYKKVKILTGLVVILIELIILVVTGILNIEIGPQIIMIMRYVFAGGIAIITGHTATDIVAILSKSKK